MIHEPSEAVGFDLIVLAIPGDMEEFVDKLVPYVHRGQLVMHAALEHGIQVLDPLETEGAIVMAAHPLFDNYYVAAAADEIGEAAVTVIIEEVGGKAYFVSDEDRAKLEVVRTLRSMEALLKGEAQAILEKAFPGQREILDAHFDAEAKPYMGVTNSAALDRMYAEIDNPLLAKAFVDLIWMYSASDTTTEPELWALNKQQEFGP